MKKKQIWMIIDEVTQIEYRPSSPIEVIYYEPEPAKTLYFVGIPYNTIKPKPERWMWIEDVKDSPHNWRVRSDFNTNDYIINEKTKEIFLKPKVYLTIAGNKNLTCFQFDTDEKAIAFAEKVAGSSDKLFIKYN
jgi:hypothetical protein